MEGAIVYRKNWTAYISYAIILLLGLFLFLIDITIFKVAGVLLMISGILKIIRTATIKWTLTKKALIIESGFLPWGKTHVNLPVFQIYDSTYNSGILGHFLNYGSITVRSNDSSNSGFREKSVKNAKDLSVRINTLVHHYEADRKSL